MKPQQMGVCDSSESQVDIEAEEEWIHEQFQHGNELNNQVGGCTVS